MDVCKSRQALAVLHQVLLQSASHGERLKARAFGYFRLCGGWFSHLTSASPNLR